MKPQTMRCELVATTEQLDDQRLLERFLNTEPRWVRNVIIRRHHPWVSSFVAGYLRRCCFGQADIEDACQNAVFWIIEAMNCFNARRAAPDAPCQFRSFLKLIVRRRLSDFVRQFRREQRGRVAFDLRQLCGTERDPELQSVDNECRRQLAAFCGQLPPRDRQLWDLIAQGMRLRSIAVALNLSYHQTKRRFRKLRRAARMYLIRQQGHDGHPQAGCPRLGDQQSLCTSLDRR